MSPRVAVLDYGIGNLFSVTKALESCGAEVTVTSDAEVFLNADRLVIPGVGAFADGMAELEKRSIVNAVREYAATGKPLLGICLGMQLLFYESMEFGVHQGLELIPGRVTAIPNETTDGKWRKTPHIGWNELRFPPYRSSWNGTLLSGIPEGSAVYFVHSFSAAPTDLAVRLADCNHEGFAISAAVQRERVFGCQFHPEKSGEIGLRVISNFLSF